MISYILQLIKAAVSKLDLVIDSETISKIKVEYPEGQLGDYASNAALILAKNAGQSPKELAEKIVSFLDQSMFEKVEVAGPGFINFYLNQTALLDLLKVDATKSISSLEKILVEYFQPNIAKPLHVGHLRTAIIGDAITRCLKYLGHNVESDTHMGDWGTQFGQLILAYKKFGEFDPTKVDPIQKLNEYYVKINQEIETDPSIHDAAKQEFVKLEQGDEENRKIWKQFVDWSMEKFLTINDLMEILPFDHHWPESFYEDKMPAVLEELKQKGLLKESQGAQIVDLEDQKLGIAVIVKSDGGTTYLLRDLATFIYRKSLGFKKQLYVVDNRQAHHYHQLFAILKMLGYMNLDEAKHISYGFISFKGEALSTRKGNMVLAVDIIKEAEEKVAKIIAEKNPNLPDKELVIKKVTIGALKYYDLAHNPKTDYEFSWEEVLDFEGNSGPYLQYTFARLSSILRKETLDESFTGVDEISATERALVIESTKLDDVVLESMQEHLPNLLANYLYNLSALINRFYHESPVLKEENPQTKAFRVLLIRKSLLALEKGLNLLGIEALPEM